MSWLIEFRLHWLIASLLHWFTQSLIQSVTHWSSDWMTCSLSHWFIDYVIGSRVFGFPGSLFYWFIDSLVQWSIQSVGHDSFMGSIGISTRICSSIDLLEPIIYFQNFRPGTAWHYLVAMICYDQIQNGSMNNWNNTIWFAICQYVVHHMTNSLPIG